MPRQMVGPLSYIGGKRSLAKRIIAMLPAHTTYVEAFAGGAQVLFHKEPSKVEVLNDLDGQVVNFYRVCHAHYGELMRYLRFTLVSRQWFAILQKVPPPVAHGHSACGPVLLPAEERLWRTGSEAKLS